MPINPYGAKPLAKPAGSRAWDDILGELSPEEVDLLTSGNLTLPKSPAPGLMLGGGALMPGGPAGAPPGPSPLNPFSLSPEHLDLLSSPDESETLAERLRALREEDAQEKPRYSTGLGALAGLFGNTIGQGVRAGQMHNLQADMEASRTKEAKRNALQMAMAQQQALAKLKTAAETKAAEDAKERAEKLADKTSGNAEWDRRNALEAKQGLQRAYAGAGIADARLRTSDELTNTRAVEREDRAAEAKKKASVVDVEERARNIDRTLGDLEKQLTEGGGTNEFTGTQNELLEGLITSYATDMAKLRDPTSVAREGEVALEKKALFQPGIRSLGMRDATALELVKKARERARERRDEAYRVRGLKPSEPDPGTPEIPTVKERRTLGDGRTIELLSDGTKRIASP